MVRSTLIKRYSIAIILGLTAGQLHAQKPDWISVMELVGKFNETDDLSYVSNAMYRCSALSLVWAALLQRDGLAEMAEQFLGNSAVAAMRGYRFYTAKIGQEYDESKSLEYIEEVQSTPMFESMATQYAKWMNDSYVKHGEYSGDSELVAEMAACREMVSE